MDKNKLLCFCLPTCNVEDMFNHLLPSLKNIGKLKDYCSFSITFQPPYTEEEIAKVTTEFDNLKLNYSYEYKEYEFEFGETPLNLMRHDCSMRYPDALFYAILDDDMSFLEGIDNEYLTILYLMLYNRNISIASFKPSLSALIDSVDFNIKLSDINKETFYTKAGEIVRGGVYYGFDGLLPEDMINLTGGRQDISTAVYRLLQGDTSITCSNGRCLHYEYRTSPGYNEYNWLNNYDSSYEGKIITNTDWLEANNYVRHIVSNLSYDFNFNEEQIDTFNNTGAILYNNSIINLLDSNNLDIDYIIDKIDNYTDENQSRLPVYNLLEDDINENLYSEVKKVTIFDKNINCLGYYIKDSKLYIILDSIPRNNDKPVLDIEGIRILSYDIINNATFDNGVIKAHIFRNGIEIASEINNEDINDWLNNKDEWQIILNLIKHSISYLKNKIKEMEENIDNNL